MVKSPLSRHDAHLVVPQPLYGNDLVVITEELGFGGRVGHPEEYDDGDDDGDDAEEEKDCSRTGDNGIGSRKVNTSSKLGFL